MQRLVNLLRLTRARGLLLAGAAAAVVLGITIQPTIRCLRYFDVLPVRQVAFVQQNSTNILVANADRPDGTQCRLLNVVDTMTSYSAYYRSDGASVRVTELAWTPVGNELSFVVRTSYGLQSEYSVMHTTMRGRAQTLTTIQNNLGQDHRVGLNYSPYNEQLAYTGQYTNGEAAHLAVYVYPPPYRYLNPTRISPAGEDAFHPVWSPTDNILIFVQLDVARRPDLYAVTFDSIRDIPPQFSAPILLYDSTGERTLDDNEVAAPTWSSDGREIIWSDARSRVLRLTLPEVLDESTEPLNADVLLEQVPEGDFRVVRLAWSPQQTGPLLLLADTNYGQQLYQMSVDGEVRRVLTDAYVDEPVGWLNGNSFYYGLMGYNRSGGSAQLHLYQQNTGDLLNEELLLTAELAAWQP